MNTAEERRQTGATRIQSRSRGRGFQRKTHLHIGGGEFLAGEPYCKAKVMRFARITEFDPVQHQPILKDWFAK